LKEVVVAVILVIENDASLRETVCADLKRAGHDVVTATTGEPLRPEELVSIIDGVLARRKTPPALAAVEGLSTADAFDGMMGTSAPMLDLFQWIVRAAPLDEPVLICGETGTGKELVARSIHRRSARAKGPFVAVNCAGVPTTLFEDQFFGHERGAFTDAKGAKLGFFEQAHGGTLFLDEVGELALDAQAKLLRVIAQREVQRLGRERPTPVNVRIVAATNVEMVQAIREGRFRKDLYWRLNGVSLHVPAVRERHGDVALLVDWFFDRIRVDLQRPAVALSSDARQALLTHTWPGNVREVEHVLRAAILTAPGEIVETVDLPPEVADAGQGVLEREELSWPEPATLRQSLASVDERLERQFIEQALTRAKGNRTEAARRLGINPRTLYAKMQRHRLRTH
jgi:DNA-binding NtrC family response regulator